MLAAFVSVVATTSLVTFLLPKSYESSATFLIESPETRPDLPALSVLERSGRLASRETEMALIESRRVVGPVVDLADLHVAVRMPDGNERPEEVFALFEAGTDAIAGTYEISRDTRGIWTVRETDAGDEPLGTAGPGTVLRFAGVTADPADIDIPADEPFSVVITPFSQAVAATQGRIDVESVHRDADLVRVTCTGKTPEQARWLCDEISNSYLTLRSGLQTVEAATAAEFLTAQTEVVRQRLVSAEDSLRAYARREQAVDLQTQAAEGIRQNAALWAQREQLRAEHASLSALIARVEGGDDGSQTYRDLASFPTFLDSRNQTVPGLFATLITLEDRRSDLAVNRSESDYELLAIDQRIAEVERQLLTLASSYDQALSTQIESLDRALVNSGAVLSNIPRQQIETARLERGVRLLEELYGFLQTRLQEAELAEAIELPGVRVVDQASLPYRHSSPRRGLNLILGILLGSGLGLLMGLWQEAADTRYRERREVEQDTGVPVLSMIPRLKVPQGLIPRRPADPEEETALAIAGDRSPDAELVLEAFRTLSADLGFLEKQQGNGAVRSIAITSSTRGEGKTFTACNLAIVRARNGYRTLIIDGDFRGRGVSRFFKLHPDAAGLADLVVEGVEDSVTSRAMSEFQISSRLYVLPAGVASASTADQLSGDRFRQILARATTTFDFVVLDTPPLNVVSDAASIASQADGVLVVVRGGVTDRVSLDFTLSRLGRSGARIAGIVLNDVALPGPYRTYSYRPPAESNSNHA
jgi:tyrosine-protein kinase Etk/Wzc